MRLSYILLASFIFLSLISSTVPFFPFDLSVTRSIQNIHLSYFDYLMRLVSSIGNGRVMPLAVMSLLTFIALLNLRLEAIYLLLSSIASLLTGGLVKLLVNRPRPEEDLVLIYKQLTDGSFPSTHTVTYTVIFGFLFYVINKKMKPSWKRSLIMGLSAFLVLTVGLSRIYLGAHWASDVLGGYLLGGFWLLQTVNIYQANAKR